jgi:hypothetical protein
MCVRVCVWGTSKVKAIQSGNTGYWGGGPILVAERQSGLPAYTPHLFCMSLIPLNCLKLLFFPSGQDSPMCVESLWTQFMERKLGNREIGEPGEAIQCCRVYKHS